MLITGSAVFPYFGQGSFTPTDAGEGAETTAAVLAPAAAAESGPGGTTSRWSASLPARPGRRTWPRSSGRGAVLRQHRAEHCLVTDQRPNTVNNYAAIDATPEILAGVLAVLGLAVLAQFILASARRRRRDFALLKVLGMFRRDLSAVAFWQVATVTAVALVVGVPLGIAGGRWAWQLFANQAGLPPDTITSLPVLWMIPATLLSPPSSRCPPPGQWRGSPQPPPYVPNDSERPRPSPEPHRTSRTWSMRHQPHSLVVDVTSSTFAARSGRATPSGARARGGAWRRSSRARRR